MAELEGARVVVIGGGAVGCAVAYSLARAGVTDVLVLERESSLASVTTPQAAGLVGQIRNSVERVRLAMQSVETFSALEDHPEIRPGWRQVGSLRLALTERRVEEFRRLSAVADEAGLEVELLDRAAAARLWPPMSFGGVRAALWCPTDGYIQPHDLTLAYCEHARRPGVRFATGTAALAIAVRGGRVIAVETDRGTVRCETVVNAAGAHAYHIARMVGLELPIVPVRHEYLVTVNAGGLESGLPVVRIPDDSLYLRAEVNALLLGGWESPSRSADPRRFTAGEEAPPIEEDWDVLASFGERLAPRYPAVRELGVRSVFRGWPTFTPDGAFIVGESCRVRGFVMAGGCNAHGVSGSAGIGRHLVEAMLETTPSPHVRSLSPDRFTETDWDWETAARQARWAYENYYAIGH